MHDFAIAISCLSLTLLIIVAVTMPSTGTGWKKGAANAVMLCCSSWLVTRPFYPIAVRVPASDTVATVVDISVAVLLLLAGAFSITMTVRHRAISRDN